VINTLFGFGLYALFVWLGLNIYVAQIVAHILGVIFNYFSYSRYTFSDMTASKFAFFLSYVVNYLLSLASLALCAQVIASPYVAGLLSGVIVSLINFFVLKRLVFRTASS
jgi:putative flippase GtrA